jgi:hypothetical protein
LSLAWHTALLTRTDKFPTWDELTAPPEEALTLKQRSKQARKKLRGFFGKPDQVAKEAG